MEKRAILGGPEIPIGPKAIYDPCPMEDLFGHTPQQSELFRPPPPPARKPLTADDVRDRMLALIATARAAETMPFEPREFKQHLAMFPIMAQWLPDEEGAQLLLAFESEMERLRLAA